MPITIGSNLSSLAAQRRLAEGTSKLSKSYERLSSGQRINRAADDAAGLAISESLKSDKRVFNQGVRNFNDGISLLNIADGAVEQLSGIVIRLKELAEQSANGTYSSTQRTAIDKEAQALSKEYTRIVHSTKFNGVHLLDGSLGDKVRLQGGYGTDGSIFSGIGGAIGTATFGGAVSHDMNTFVSYDVALGDLNGDGFTDMVTSGSGGGATAAVRLGNGDGTFDDETIYNMATGESRGLTLGDINGDGILDIVTASTGGGVGSATTRLGNGDGTFGSAVSYLMDATHSRNVALGDLNGDGNLDMITGGWGGGTGRATVRLGNGDGTFGSSTSYQMDNSNTYTIALGDLNGDGILDMMSGGSAAGSATSTVRLGTGTGSFGAAVSYSMSGVDSRSVNLGDLNGDGILDVVAVGVGGSGSVAVRLGNGDGTFRNVTSYQLDNAGGGTIGDLNGDGILDIVTVHHSGGGMTSLGNGDGTFGTATSFQINASLAANNVELGDLNGDGVFDIVTASYNNGTFAGYATVNLGNIQDGSSPLLPFSLGTLAGARQALPVFDQKIQQLAKQRGQIGAFQSRVQVGINNLQTASENFAAAESRIRDADIAHESSELLRLNILQQAASSVLGQANLQPALALNLLQK